MTSDDRREGGIAEERPEIKDRFSHRETQGQEVPDRGSSKCKVPGVRPHLSRYNQQKTKGYAEEW